MAVLDEPEREVGGGLYDVAVLPPERGGPAPGRLRDGLALMVAVLPGEGVAAATRSLRVRRSRRAAATRRCAAPWRASYTG